MVFADLLGNQTSMTSLYYYHRPVLGLEFGSTGSEDQMRQLWHSQRHLVDYVVVAPEQSQWLVSEMTDPGSYSLRARIMLQGREKLLVFGRLAVDAPPDIVDGAEANRQFDERFSSLATVIDIPFAHIQRLQRELAAREHRQP